MKIACSRVKRCHIVTKCIQKSSLGLEDDKGTSQHASLHKRNGNLQIISRHNMAR